MKNQRFLIASGGTGGHFYPGFALGLALQKQGANVLFVVRQNDPAAAVLKDNGLAYREIALSGGLPRSINPMRHGRFIKGLVRSLAQTRALIKVFRPDVVLGMGGYVSFPLVLCARLSGVKTAVHESNAIWGLANKLCGYFATVRLLGLPMKKMTKKDVLVSTPIRAEFANTVNRVKLFDELGLCATARTVLVMGGSQGAKGLNEALPDIIKNLPDWQFIHLTGTRWYETQLKHYKGLPNVRALAYSNEVYKLMKSADVIICRSGASTLAEIMACHVPAIFVPFPHAAANHQYFNARILEQAGCARIVPEGASFQKRLQQTLETLRPTELSAMIQAFTKVPVPNPLDACNTITNVLEKL